MSSSQDMGRSNKGSSTQIAVQEQNRLNEKPKIEENQNVVQKNNRNKNRKCKTEKDNNREIKKN